MIYKVSINHQVSVDLKIINQFEQIVDTEEEAEKFGEDSALLASAFMKGFGEATLS